VRAFDLVRYRNFRTLTTPEPQQFLSLAVDPGGEVACAGTLDSFQVRACVLGGAGKRESPGMRIEGGRKGGTGPLPARACRSSAARALWL
jgi:hypothetical protein